MSRRFALCFPEASRAARHVVRRCAVAAFIPRLGISLDGTSASDAAARRAPFGSFASRMFVSAFLPGQSGQKPTGTTSLSGAGKREQNPARVITPYGTMPAMRILLQTQPLATEAPRYYQIQLQQ